VKDAVELARVCAAAADRVKGADIVLLHVGPLAGITDYFVISTGSNPRQLRAMAEAVEEDAEAAGARKLGREGGGDACWILVDYGDVVVHLFLPDARAFYDLEGLWGDAAVERHGEEA
jgi:ribosome-associated protein